MEPHLWPSGRLAREHWVGWQRSNQTNDTNSNRAPTSFSIISSRVL